MPRRAAKRWCDPYVVVLCASALIALRLIAVAPALEAEVVAEDVSVFFCGPKRAGDMSNSYAASWVATRGRFLLGVPLGMPFTRKHLSPGLMRRPGFRLGDHVDWRTVNMEGASYVMMRRAAKARARRRPEASGRPRTGPRAPP